MSENTAREMATELMRCDSQMKTWETKRRAIIDWFVENGYSGKEVLTVSGDYKVSLSTGIERALNDAKLIDAIGEEMYKMALDRKRDKVKLTMTDVKGIVDPALVADIVEATVRATMRKI